MLDGIVNLRYTHKGMHFDAAIDYGYILHPYTPAQRAHYLPIELYNLDEPDWDIHMVFLPKGNPVEFEDIIKATDEWGSEMMEGIA